MKYAIIGYPVEHSLSPVMHQAGYKEVELKAEYHRIPVQSADLCQRIQYLKDNHYAGWNVTYPLKEDIIPYLDQISPEAERIGAVNTVKVVDSLLIGQNTDGEGFVQSIRTKGYSLQGKRVVILGAGGAAKAIAVAMVQHECEMLILNRDVNKAKRLARKVLSLGGKATGVLLEKGDWLHEVDLLIQTTPIGMNGESYPFDLAGINSSAWVVDLIYHPAVTPFLEDAESQGCQTMNGLEMLLYQGVLAWEFWLNIEAPVSVMRKALRQRSMG